ncbi:MAG: lipid A export permease/ATP-binding protein MsbA, partial [Gammaproteobacteria bacterium]|nr:lipid A export permease/ATP-binding protein MsbA [Gammaproteobacteria bacterium]
MSDSSIQSYTTAKLYRRLFPYIRRHGWFFLWGVLASVFYSAVDSYFAHFMKPLLDVAFIQKNVAFVKIVPFIIMGIFIARGIVNFIANYCMSRVGRDIVLMLRNQVFCQLLRLPKSYYDKNNSGGLLSKIIYNVDQVSSACTNAITTAVQAVALILGLFIVMLLINWRITLMYVVALPIIAWIVRYASQRMRRVSSKVQNSLGLVTHVAEESIENNQVVKTFAGETYEVQKFELYNQQNRDLALKIVTTRSVSTSLIQFIGAGILAFTVYLTTLQGASVSLTAGGFVALLVSMIGIMKPLRDLTNVNNIIQQGMAGAESIFVLLDEPVEQDTGTRSIKRARGEVEYKAVTFAYQSSRGAVLQDISFSLQPGKSLALVGRSGGGKSTLVSLLPRFYDVVQGAILIDGINIQDLTLTSLRQQIAVVSQQVTLFNDTVRHNIAYGGLANASDDQIWQAIRGAHAEEFIRELPEGLDTMVGENGVLLSGGQRQRLAIARAILKDAPILILDEATSALDTESERHIQAALNDLMKNRTTLVIA